MGHYSTGFGEIQCGTGSYQDEVGQVECKLCPGRFHLRWVLISASNVRLDSHKLPKVRVRSMTLENFNPCAACQSVKSVTLGCLCHKINLPVTLAQLDFLNPQRAGVAVTHVILANFNSTCNAKVYRMRCWKICLGEK